LKHHFPELNHNEQVIIPLLEVCKRLGSVDIVRVGLVKMLLFKVFR
jgi:hypothetical protein